MARQDEYDREFLEYEDPAIYKALMQQEASEQRPTYSNTGTMVQNIPDNVYESGKGRRAVASALGNIIGDDYATGLIGGDPNKYAGLGALDAVGVGGAIDFADSWKFFNKINADKTRVENELIEEGYERNSESFNNEVTNRMPEYHGKGEAFFHTLLAPLEIATLGATSKMVAGGRVVKNALNKKIDKISRKLMSLKGAPGALPVVAEATSGALPSGNLSDNIQAIRDSASKLRSEKGALPNVDFTQTGFTFKDVKPVGPILNKFENRRLNSGMAQGEVTTLPIRSMYASQKNVNPDFLTTESSSGRLPLVIKKNNQLFVSDGHHRLTKLASEGEQNARVRLIDFDEPTNTPLLDYNPNQQAEDNALLEKLFNEIPIKKPDDLTDSIKALQDSAKKLNFRS